MSTQTYIALWKDTQKDLETLAVNDYENQALDPEFDRTIAQKSTYKLYLKYICISNRLEVIYDQMLQPQKRILIKKLYDSCLGRVLELKYDLVNLDMMEFSYNDDVMTELNLTPIDIELQIPRYIHREREQDILYKKKFIDNLMIKLGWLEGDTIEERLTELEAIRVIQMHERARQGRLRAQFMKEIRILKEKGKPDGVKERTDGLVAAMKIQKLWRGFTTRRKIRRKKLDEMILIGMIPPICQKNMSTTDDSTKILNNYYKLQAEYQVNYENSLVHFKNEISKKQGIHITEEIADEIRNWFRDYKTRTGKLPDFPSEESGGSRHLLSRQGFNNIFN